MNIFLKITIVTSIVSAVLYVLTLISVKTIGGEMNKPTFSILKLATIGLLLFSSIAGFLAPVPRLPILNETIRNLYFHVPMWFGMTFLLFLSLVGSILYLRTEKSRYDLLAIESANTGILFGILGILTGMVWAKFTWGTYWTKDPKLNSAAIGMLIYTAYFILRGSFQDEQQRMKVSAIFNIIAFFSFVALIYVYPRLTNSLHPGNGGNPGFNAYDRDSQMNIIFYSACTGFIFLGIWITSLKARLKSASEKLADIKEEQLVKI